MHKNIEILIGRLATDRRLQSLFARNPYKTLREQGLELTDVEMASLATIDPNAFRTFTDALDARLCKASLTNGDSQSRTQISTEPKSGSRQETK